MHQWRLPGPLQITTSEKKPGPDTSTSSSSENNKAGMLLSCRPSQAAAFTEQQLKQLRAQCLVFLSIRNNMVPTKKHLEIALCEFSAEGSSSHGGSGSGGSGGGGDNRGETETGLSSAPVVFSVPTAVLPPADHLDMSRLAGCRPPGGTTRRIVRRGPRKMQ